MDGVPHHKCSVTLSSRGYRLAEKRLAPDDADDEADDDADTSTVGASFSTSTRGLQQREGETTAATRAEVAGVEAGGDNIVVAFEQSATRTATFAPGKFNPARAGGGGAAGGAGAGGDSSADGDNQTEETCSWSDGVDRVFRRGRTVVDSAAGSAAEMRVDAPPPPPPPPTTRDDDDDESVRRERNEEEKL